MRIDTGKLILRFAVGGLMAFHGLSKLRHGVAWMGGPLSAHHLPAALAYGVYLAEVVAPVLVILGIFTRPSGLVIAFDMVMALYLVMDGRTFALDKQTGALLSELQFLYMLGGVAIFFLGSGRYALSKGKGRWD
ncbi:MAG TPA: DoxX family protein [Thermoanaerobaculia bacterium]|jgi:putative oxidoreductase|nr:DoxX family protein [Thermoanaerobaculia bacterium]